MQPRASATASLDPIAETRLYERFQGIIGDKTSMEYKILRIPRYVALFIICGFTVAIGILCMYNEDFSVTRSTLTYFGVPYFVGLVYYLLKMLRRVRSVQKRRHL